MIDHHTWSTTAFGRHSPWGEEDSPALVSEVESALEGLSGQLMSSGAKTSVRRLAPGDLLTERGAMAGDELYLLLDGVMRIEVDGQSVADLGPGALLGERAALEGNRRTATLRAVTRCGVAVARHADVQSDALADWPTCTVGRSAHEAVDVRRPTPAPRPARVGGSSGDHLACRARRPGRSPATSSSAAR